MATEKLFTVAGITTHSREDVTVTKVRFGTDLVRLSKMLSSNRKIGVSRDLGGRGDGYLDSIRVSLVELPEPMMKQNALEFLLTNQAFQSPEDQALIQDTLNDFIPKAPVRARKAKSASGEVVVKAGRGRKAKSAVPSLDALTARAQAATIAALAVNSTVSE